MKVFVSSLISGMEAERAAVKDAIETLGHQPLMAEDFGARPSSPQITCLQGVREADVVVLVLGPRYGSRQPSGISATHEEFREARTRKPIYMFVTAEPLEADQQAFVEEEGGWVEGLFRETYSSPAELGRKVMRQLHRHVAANAAGPVDGAATAQLARDLLGQRDRQTSRPMVGLSLATAPRQTLLRPAEMEARQLEDAIQSQALFGPRPIFDRSLGMQVDWQGESLVVYQGDRHHNDEHSAVRVNAAGDVVLRLPVQRPGERSSGLPAIIEEDIASVLTAGVDFCKWWLTRIDPTERASHVALAARLDGSNMFQWRTRSEHAANPNQGSMGMWGYGEDRPAVQLTPALINRASLNLQGDAHAEDLLVLLRRQARAR